MSTSTLKPYFRTHLEALGFKEWEDAFNTDNIPGTRLKKAFHLELGAVGETAQSQSVLQFTQPISVKVFRKGFRQPALAVDKLALDQDTILKRVLKASNKFGEDAIINISLDVSEITAFEDTNDNFAVLQMEFDATLCLDIEG